MVAQTGSCVSYPGICLTCWGADLTDALFIQLHQWGVSDAGLTLGNDGNFYGTTEEGGSGYGTVFQVTTNGTLTTLVSFNGPNGDGSGRRPDAGQ